MQGVREILALMGDLHGSWFERGMILVVIMNVVVIVWQFLSARDCQISVKEAELGFVLIFWVEVLLKMLANGPHRYFSSGYNM